jgi:hypothetical protein
MSDEKGFLGAGSSRQLIIRAERQREKQLASLFYKTAGGAPSVNRMERTQQSKKKRSRRNIGFSATTSGGQPFSGVRQQSKRNTKKKKSRSMMISKSRRRMNAGALSQSLPLLTNGNGINDNEEGKIEGRSALADDFDFDALDDFANAAMASTTRNGIASNRAWEANQANDAALHRFTQLGGAETLQRPAPPVDHRTPVADGYKTYKNEEEQQLIVQRKEEQEEQQQEEEHAILMGGHVQTLGGMNLPYVSSASSAVGALPILSLG